MGVDGGRAEGGQLPGSHRDTVAVRKGGTREDWHCFVSPTWEGLTFEGCRGLEMKEVRTRVVVILGVPRDGHLRRRKIGKPVVQ